MIKSDFADLTNRPHTLKKIYILENYLSAWADIILGNWRNSVSRMKESSIMNYTTMM